MTGHGTTPLGSSGTRYVFHIRVAHGILSLSSDISYGYRISGFPLGFFPCCY